jgi:acetamidase/formamidase
MRTHRFRPTRVHNTLGPHEPVLVIGDGDTVITTTVDAHGRDANRELIGAGPNPQTGPFYVEGAEEGDTLAVRLDRLAPNREFGYTSAALVPHVVDAGYVRSLPEPSREPWPPAEWRVDVEAGTATLVRPETKLGAFEVALAPMLGCFGVAPPDGQAISASTSGPYGGNMDYRGFCAGVTAYFPVFVEGALFSLGDGHAVQGDGEVIGTGIEISFDVEFTVRVLKGKRIYWPRGENEEYIFTVGNARPLDQAAQHATTEMMRWLRADYGLDPAGASILLGQCVEYDVGNIIDPAYTMVCKVAKGVPGRVPLLWLRTCGAV